MKADEKFKQAANQSACDGLKTVPFTSRRKQRFGGALRVTCKCHFARNMDAMKRFVSDNLAYIGLGVCAAGVSVVIGSRYLNKKKERVCGVDYPKDVVIVHQFHKGDLAPSFGHFVMKLETYLRMANIPYEPEYCSDMGPKKKLPWIEYNGVTMGDSQLIINFLNEKLKVNLNRTLSKEQRAFAWAIQKWIEEHMYHLNVYTRWGLLPEEMSAMMPSMPSGMRRYLINFVPKWQYFVGIGRHTPQEVNEMMVFDLRQLSTILGSKKFIMGGDKPTEVDCAAFGILSQVYWQTPNSCPGVQVLKSELTNLVAYIERIKQMYWPDWNKRVTGSADKETSTTKST